MNGKLNIESMVEMVKNTSGFTGGTAVILGSGLGEFAHQLEKKKIIPYHKIPGYPSTTVPGHSGELVSGFLNGKPVLVAKGRFHYYEGHDWDTLVLPVRLFNQLNVKNLIITNSSGSMIRSISPGTLVVIRGFLDCTFRDSMPDPSIVLLNSKTSSLISIAKQHAKDGNILVKEGIYCWASGPSYETPAEISYFRSLGGDVVGMSTVPELLEANTLGMNVLGISCATNYAAGLSDTPLNHEEVLETAEKVKNEFINLLNKMIQSIPTEN